MLFNSYAFILLFMPVVVGGRPGATVKYRRALLVDCSQFVFLWLVESSVSVADYILIVS